MSSIIISMEKIKKNFGEKAALNDVSFSIEENEIFGLLGPSGAGKTTIIKILTSQISQTSGKATLLGVDTNKITEKIYAQIGMVLETSGLYTRLNCYDNLSIFAEIYNIDKKKIPEVIERVKLSEAIKRTVSKLSKGMAQRLVLARAILHEPKVLFLDEPTSGIDPATTLEIHKLIFELREKGTTIFLTTHNMEEAAQLCDNVALLNDGVIIEYGAPDAICREYNETNNIYILLNDGREITLPNNTASAGQISRYFSAGDVAAIHSSEPNLESVFISLTGRKLV